MIGLLRLLPLAVLLALALPAPARAANEAWFGMGVSAGASNVLLGSPLKELKVASVAPASPAESGGLRVGDLIVEIEGTPVAGRKLKDLARFLDGKKPGDTLSMKLRRAGGEVYSVTLVGLPRPAG